MAAADRSSAAAEDTRYCYHPTTCITVVITTVDGTTTVVTTDVVRTRNVVSATGVMASRAAS